MAAKLQAEAKPGRLLAVIEPRSNTMNLGVHQEKLVRASQAAQMVIWFKPEKSGLDFNQLIAESEVPGYAFPTVEEIVMFLEENARSGDHIVIMSNGGFGGIHEKLLQALKHGP